MLKIGYREKMPKQNGVQKSILRYYIYHYKTNNYDIKEKQNGTLQTKHKSKHERQGYNSPTQQ